MEVDGADTRYQDLPLGNLGIFCEVNEKRRIRVIFPKLTSKGDVEYIYSWHDLKSIHIPDLEKNEKGRVHFKIAQQLAFLIKEHIQFVEPEILNLRKQWYKISELLDLVATSELYASQQEIYERALFQVENLLDKAEELRQVSWKYSRFWERFPLLLKHLNKGLNHFLTIFSRFFIGTPMSMKRLPRKLRQVNQKKLIFLRPLNHHAVVVVHTSPSSFSIAFNFFSTR